MTNKKMVVLKMSVWAFFVFSIFLISNTNLSNAATGLQNAGTVLGNVSTRAGFGPTNPDPQAALATLIANIIRFALTLVGAIFLLLMIYGGYKWMTARGEPEGVKTAISTIKNASIGLIIVLAAYIISSFVLNMILNAITSRP